MGYSTLGSVSTGDLIAPAWGNLVDSNFEDHEIRISAVASVPQGYINGLEISNNGSDADHDIDIAAGQAVDDTNSQYLTLASGLTKQIDATFAKGTNQGGLDTGTVAADTFYYIWIIEQDSTSDIDILISASQTSPTMPSGWTAKAFTGDAVLTDGSANILAFYQYGNRFVFDVKINEVANTSPGTSQNTPTISGVPSDYLGIFVCTAIDGSASGNAYFQETDMTDTAPSSALLADMSIEGGARNSIIKEIQVDSSSQIAYRVSQATADVYINTIGFINAKR